MSKKRTFASTTEVIEALGGTAAVAAMTGRLPGAASNWLNIDHFPSNTYVIMRDALLALGHEAPPDWLWDMAPRAHRKPRRAKAVARKPVSIEAA
jgi:hypothetical protein